MPRTPLPGVQKISRAPARLENFFGPQPPGFGFNQVGGPEYIQVLIEILGYSQLTPGQLSRIIQDIALFDAVLVP